VHVLRATTLARSPDAADAVTVAMLTVEDGLFEIPAMAR
jgi:hypothetical protein